MPDETTPATLPPVADLDTFDRLLRRETNESERELLLPTLARLGESTAAVRTSEQAWDRVPALAFAPLLPAPAVDVPRGVSLLDIPLPAYNGDVETLAFAPAAELARLLRAGRVSSSELTRMYLGRLKRYGPGLVCVVSLCEERALQEAQQADKEIAEGRWRGPLHGIPYGLKDLFAAEGTHTTNGAVPYRDLAPDFDCTVAAQLRMAGAVLVAKLSMGELALGDVWFGGTTRNPWKPDTGSSGSSAGSASAVAAGLVGFAIGTETYGSIVSPSVRCGTTGLRPTFGRVSRYGAMALSWSMDKIGPMCRSVEDCTLVFDTIYGQDGQDGTVLPAPFTCDLHAGVAGLRVGMDEAAFKAEGVTDAHRAVLDVLRELGISPVPVTLPPTNPAYDALPLLTIQAEGAAAFAELAAAGGLRELAQQGAWNWPNLLRAGAMIPASDYLQAQRARRRLQEEMNAALADVDVYVTVPLKGPSLAYTNLTGHPTVITRCGLSDDGLPLMIEFTGNLLREDAALRLAYAFEQKTGHNKQWPGDLPETAPPLHQDTPGLESVEEKQD